MILPVRVALNILGRGYSRERSLRVGRIQNLQGYYGCMGSVSQPFNGGLSQLSFLCSKYVKVYVRLTGGLVPSMLAGAGKTKLV